MKRVSELTKQTIVTLINGSFYSLSVEAGTLTDIGFGHLIADTDGPESDKEWIKNIETYKQFEEIRALVMEHDRKEENAAALLAVTRKRHNQITAANYQPINISEARQILTNTASGAKSAVPSHARIACSNELADPHSLCPSCKEVTRQTVSNNRMWVFFTCDNCGYRTKSEINE